MDTLVITAYYPVKTRKHSTNEYDIWIQNFFDCVTCPVIFFCDSQMKLKLEDKAGKNIRFIERDFYSFKLMQEPWKSRWEEFHKIDSEKHLHSPELYAVWGAKQEFVQEAIQLQESKSYVWCDVGCFRFKREGSFKNTLNFIQPEKITCLDTSLMYSKIALIGGGVLAGDKKAWEIFSNNYLQELEKNIDGKDQIIYRRILNISNANIINPTYQYGDAWFFLTYIFSY